MITLIKIRPIKWGVAALIWFLFSLSIWLGPMGGIADNPLDLVIEDSPVTMPFLPLYFHRCLMNIETFIIRFTVMYLIYFWGAILYWYCIYVLSKKIVAQIKKEK
ncbi:MAG: hypothetical protein FWF54_09545 [Candidatus Azobacteroides sp.]|nr:hypothetical protein [Candidatus Azobacteroides sp.]